ncbi:MAG: WG repeat-containing protein [Saprospiraceae bacterium]|nr:WG repeat-containing protein [Candidatus Vicinibacter affinis]MBK9639970.1 WG repeat-containing protein [Candidatus Vicinibacter affinis]
MDSNKNIIVNPKFTEAYPIFNSLGRIKKNGKYGFINNKGKILIKANYDLAGDFIYSSTKVKKKNKTYYINQNGCKQKASGLISCVHTHLEYPYHIADSSSLKIFKSNYEKELTVLILSDVESLYLIYQILIAKKNNKFAIYDLVRHHSNPNLQVQNTEFKYDSIKYFECEDMDGKLQEYIAIKQDRYWGFVILKYSNELINPKYLSVSPFISQYSLVEFEPGNFGYIDINGVEYFFRSERINDH